MQFNYKILISFTLAIFLVIVLYSLIINFMNEKNYINSKEYVSYKVNNTNLDQAATCTIISHYFSCKDKWNTPYEFPYENISESDLMDSKKNITVPSIDYSNHQNSRLIDTIIEKYNTKNVILNKAINNIPKNNTCIKNEPSVASNGTYIIYTGNHYASISKSDVNNWKFIDPGYKFPFCCDQRIIYDNNNGIFIWYIQGERINDIQSDNYLRLAISKDATKWELYQFEPHMLSNGLHNKFFDFPNLAIDNSFLYLTTNLLDYIDQPSNKGSLIFRVSLPELRQSIELDEFQSIHIELFNDPKASTITPVKGATNEMYLATILKNENKMRIYNMNQSSYLKQYDITIHDFFPLYRNGTLDCGKNSSKWGWWCGSIGTKVTTGWIDKDKIGFLWPANKFMNQTNINSIPYIDGAIFDIHNKMREVARPYLSNSNFTFAFADVAINGNKDLGIISFYGNKTNANLAFGVYDNNSIPPWKMMSLLNSTEKITNPLFDPDFKRCYSDLQKMDRRQYQWGDYITINKFPTNNSLWEIAAYIMKENNWHGSQPYYILIKK